MGPLGPYPNPAGPLTHFQRYSLLFFNVNIFNVGTPPRIFNPCASMVDRSKNVGKTIPFLWRRTFWCWILRIKQKEISIRRQRERERERERKKKKSECFLPLMLGISLKNDFLGKEDRTFVWNDDWNKTWNRNWHFETVEREPHLSQIDEKGNNNWSENKFINFSFFYLFTTVDVKLIAPLKLQFFSWQKKKGIEEKLLIHLMFSFI